MLTGSFLRSRKRPLRSGDATRPNRPSDLRRGMTSRALKRICRVGVSIRRAVRLKGYGHLLAPGRATRGWFQIGEVPEQAPRRRRSGRVLLHVVHGEQSAGKGCPARRGGSVLLARANVPACVRRCCYALAGVLAVATVVELVPVASRGGDSRPVLRRERAQAARLGAELRSSRQQLRLSQNQLRSSHNQLRSSRQLQWSQSQARSSWQALAQARRAVVVARSQAAANTHRRDGPR